MRLEHSYDRVDLVRGGSKDRESSPDSLFPSDEEDAFDQGEVIETDPEVEEDQEIDDEEDFKTGEPSIIEAKACGSRKKIIKAAATCAKYLADEVDLTSFLRGHSGATSAQIYDRYRAIKMGMKAVPRMRDLEKEYIEGVDDPVSKFFIDGKLNLNLIPVDLKEILENDADAVDIDEVTDLEKVEEVKKFDAESSNQTDDEEAVDPDLPLKPISVLTSRGMIIGQKVGEAEEAIGSLKVPMYL
uniref:BRF1 domain-containing protein n=1 Tax=Parastrongyloides trichosuri TaxID=131310 RepID=A0A0N4ZLI0_PARTI